MSKFTEAIEALLLIRDSKQPKDANVYSGWRCSDKLRDFRDYIELKRLGHEDKSRRSGLTSFNPDSLNPFRPDHDLNEAILLASQCSKSDMRVLVKIANRLREALEPIANKSTRTQARGTIQILRVRGYPYLYYRYWVTEGGDNKSQKRYKTKYIGLPQLAGVVEAIREQHKPRSKERKEIIAFLVDAYHEGRLSEELTTEFQQKFGNKQN